ncbi:MAG: hypothetical protein VB031_02525 [Eubacteriaceae bacterium]|nr:hypothetical protein [Eubacteriaceae bacterium]
MKKKITALIVALAMALTIVPSAAFAAQTKVNGNILEYYREAALESLDETYSDSVESQSRYCSLIWNSMNSVYEKEKTRIKNAVKIGQLGTDYGLFFILSDEGQEAEEVITALSDLRKNKVKSISDFSTIKKQNQRRLTILMSYYKKSDYNDYYWDMVQDKKYEATVRLNSATDFIGLAKAITFIDDYIAEEDEEEYEDGEPIDDGDEGDYNEEGFDFTDYYDDGTLYTKDDLTHLRRELNDFLNVYVKQQLKGQAAKQKAAASVKAGYIKKMAGIQDVDGIVACGYDCLDAMVAKTGVELKEASANTKAAINRQLDALYDQYYSDDYSDRNWSKIEGYFEDAYDTVDEAEYEMELQGGIVSNVQKKIKKLKTLARELKTAKAQYVKKLKSYKGKKKYHQKKLNKVIKAGTAAINRAYTVEDVQYTYSQYLAKVKKCVKTYTVSVKKYGKGKVTKSKKVSYGKSFTVKMKPKKGYRVSKITVDGKRVTSKKIYKFKNVKKKHRIRVWFGKK